MDTRNADVKFVLIEGCEVSGVVVGAENCQLNRDFFAALRAIFHAIRRHPYWQPLEVRGQQAVPKG